MYPGRKWNNEAQRYFNTCDACKAEYDPSAPGARSWDLGPCCAEEYSPAFQDEYKRLWHRDAEALKDAAPMLEP